MESFGNQTSFVSRNRTILILFDTKHPFTPHNVMVGRMRYKNPCTVASKSNKLIIHGSTPVGILKSLRGSSRLKEHRKRMLGDMKTCLKARKLFGTMDIILRTGYNSTRWLGLRIGPLGLGRWWQGQRWKGSIRGVRRQRERGRGEIIPWSSITHRERSWRCSRWTRTSRRTWWE